MTKRNTIPGKIFQDPEQQLVDFTIEKDISYKLSNLYLTIKKIKIED